MVLCSGCLVDPPPDFEEPERTAPIMFLDRAVPALGQPLVLQRNTPGVPFTVPVQSEDLGDELLASVWANFGLEGETRIKLEPFRPGTFDQVREIQFTLETNRLPRGCVPITLVLHHNENFDRGTLKPLDFTLATMATWWAVVDADPANVSFADCPRPSDTQVNQ